MRAHAAVAILAACYLTHAQRLTRTPDHLAHRLLTCAKTLGPSKCLSALSVWRAENSVMQLENDPAPQFNVTADLERFPWQQYGNISNDQLYTQLCDGAEILLRYRPLKLHLSGYSLGLESKGNGTLNVDVFQNTETDSARSSMKKLQKRFYNILPLLMVPGLIMSAILPFVLPALKLMTVGAVMLNNMALSGAIFTLLRNNAFTDHYEKKIIYTNEGYKNEKNSHLYIDKDVPLENVEEYSSSNFHGVVEGPVGGNEDFDVVEERPTNADWIHQYYGYGGPKVHRSSRPRTP